jgi:hypothetical protein
MTMLCALAGAVVGNAYGERSTPAGAEQFVLSGVLVDGEGGGRAWLLEPTLTQNRVIAVRPGDTVGPYRLTTILDDRVEMEGPAGKILVPLYTAGTTSLKAVASVTPSGPVSMPAREASAGTPAASVAGVEPAGSAQPPRGQSFQQSLQQQTTQPGIPAAESPGIPAAESNDLAGGDVPEGNPSPAPPSAVSLGSITPQTFAPPEPLQHLQQALELTRESSAIVEPGPPTSQPTAPTRRVYEMGDSRLRGALRSLLGGGQ